MGPTKRTLTQKLGLLGVVSFLSYTAAVVFAPLAYPGYNWMAQASGCAPARENCYSYEEVNGDEVVMAMKETAENAVPMPNLPEMDVMWTVASGLLTDVNMAGNDVAESAEKAQKEALQLIESMK